MPGVNYVGAPAYLIVAVQAQPVAFAQTAPFHALTITSLGVSAAFTTAPAAMAFAVDLDQGPVVHQPVHRRDGAGADAGPPKSVSS
jgi:hypothetical protein